MTNCEDCINYYYDDEYECNSCLMQLDEDEMYKFVTGSFDGCPYYRPGNDYTIVRKQN